MMTPIIGFDEPSLDQKLKADVKVNQENMLKSLEKAKSFLKQTDILTMKKLASNTPLNLIKIFLSERTSEYSDCLHTYLSDRDLKPLIFSWIDKTL